MPFPNGNNVKWEDLQKSGAWFPVFVHHLLGGKLGESWAPGADLDDAELGFIEIKSSGNNNGFGISMRQLKKHRKRSDLSIPHKTSTYALLGYRNMDPRNVPGSLLKRTPAKKINAFFTKQTNVLFLLDVKVIEALGRIPETKVYGSAYDHGFILKRRVLYKCFRTTQHKPLSSRETFKRLKLPFQRFSISDRWITTTYQGHPMFFRAIFVLKNETHHLFEDRISQRGGQCVPWKEEDEAQNRKLLAA